MRKITMVLLVVLMPFIVMAKDKIHLKSGKTKSGKITNIDRGIVTLEHGKKMYDFTPDEVELIEFDLGNIDIARIISENAEDWGYADGQMDAVRYHNRFAGNFVLGFAFGIFGFVGVAVGNVKDPPTYIEDWETKMKSYEYTEGYRKKGKGKNLGAAGAGWAAWIVILLLLV